MVNCVLASVAAQHIKAAINANNMHLDNKSRFCCQDFIFYDGIENSGRFDLSLSHRSYGLSWIF